MKKLENQKVTALYFTIFEGRKHDVKGVNLLLNSIRLYGCESDGKIIQQIDFKVICVDGHCYICPDVLLYDKYMLCADRLVNATVYNFEKGECIKLEENDGSLSIYTY